MGETGFDGTLTVVGGGDDGDQGFSRGQNVDSFCRGRPEKM